MYLVNYFERWNRPRRVSNFAKLYYQRIGLPTFCNRIYFELLLLCKIKFVIYYNKFAEYLTTEICVYTGFRRVNAFKEVPNWFWLSIILTNTFTSFFTVLQLVYVAVPSNFFWTTIFAFDTNLCKFILLLSYNYFKIMYKWIINLFCHLFAFCLQYQEF